MDFHRACVRDLALPSVPTDGRRPHHCHVQEGPLCYQSDDVHTAVISLNLTVPLALPELAADKLSERVQRERKREFRERER